MQLLDSNSHPYTSTVTVPTDSDGFVVYSFDDSGVPLQCTFSLVPGGTQSSHNGIVFYGGKNGTPWIGTLAGGFYASGAISAIITAPAYSATYQPPFASLNDAVNYATLTAISGTQQRQIMIIITPTTKGNF
jgi:hypothetical protein